MPMPPIFCPKCHQFNRTIFPCKCAPRAAAAKPDRKPAARVAAVKVKAKPSAAIVPPPAPETMEERIRKWSGR